MSPWELEHVKYLNSAVHTQNLFSFCSLLNTKIEATIAHNKNKKKENQ